MMADTKGEGVSSSATMMDESEPSSPTVPESTAQDNGQVLRASQRRQVDANATTVEQASQSLVSKRRTLRSGGSITIKEEIGFDAALEMALAESLQDTSSSKPDESAVVTETVTDKNARDPYSDHPAKLLEARRTAPKRKAAAHAANLDFSSPLRSTYSATQVDDSFAIAFKIKEARYAKAAARTDHLLRLPPTAKYVYVNKDRQPLVNLNSPPYNVFAMNNKPEGLHPVLKEAEKNGTATIAMHDWYGKMPHHVNIPVAGIPSNKPHRLKATHHNSDDTDTV